MNEPSKVTKWIRSELQNHIDETYKQFHTSLVPGLTEMMGVRIPILRELAKKAAKEDYCGFVQDFQPEIYEEVMIRGMMIGYGKFSIGEQQRELRKFIPLIHNWAVCDSCCTTYKFMKKNQEEWFSFFEPYLNSGQEYEIRFAVVCFLDFFIREAFIDRILSCFSNIHHEGYYVKMAVAWAISVCYVKFSEKTEEFLRKNTLDDFTHNKAIQKIRESYRVSKEDKERLNQWKRKEKNKEDQEEHKV
ncbi:MAG: DNA alkylation repair protein [Blautia sp.]|uniref:DNA alkylation repair protein n=1 Tax=Blautia sp. TaxID=1955243 RepID=UPI002E79C8A7|nr:DNA alkylation repair protein [Blautia sp.]MEE1444826.1 DNA alkylation repair protein [Blautia sp.]